MTVVVVELLLLHVTDPEIGALLANAVDGHPEAVRDAVARLHADDEDGSPDGVYVTGAIAAVDAAAPLQVVFERRWPVLKDTWTNDLGQPVVAFERVPWVRVSAEADALSSGEVETRVAFDGVELEEVSRGTYREGAHAHVDRTDVVPASGSLALHQVTPAVWILEQAVPVEDRVAAEALAAARTEAFSDEVAQARTAGRGPTEREIRRLLR